MFLTRCWQEAVGAFTPWLAVAEDKTACSEAGGANLHGQQMGRHRGHNGRIIPNGTRLINGTFISPFSPHPTHPHLWSELFKDVVHCFLGSPNPHIYMVGTTISGAKFLPHLLPEKLGIH